MKGIDLLKNMAIKFSFTSIVLIFLFVSVRNVRAQAQKQIPRSEHPKPQFHRETWLNLNGQWNFGICQRTVGNDR